MHTRLLPVALALLAALACSRGKARSTARAPLLERLPAGAQLVAGLTRSGGEQEARDALLAVHSVAKNGMPVCIVDVYAKIELAVVAMRVDRAGETAFSVGLQGAGLRPTVDACLRHEGVTITQDGVLSRYAIGDWGPLPVVWLDDATVVFAPGDQGATVALASGATPLGSDVRIAPLLGRLGADAVLWLVVDVDAIPRVDDLWIAPPPRPDRAWGQVGGKGLDARLTLELKSPEDARRLAVLAEQLLARVPTQLALLTDTVKIKTDGVLVVVTADLGPLLVAIAGDLVPVDKAFSSVAVLGVLAVIAIPAVMQNQRREKTEAVNYVEKMYDGARSYREDPAAPGSSTSVPRLFPVGHVGPTPPLGACCLGADHRCAPDAALWTDPIWQALEFRVAEPSQYSYEYRSDGKQFSADAYGDLDCDGVYSTFEMVGSVSSDGTVTGAATMFKDRELE
jgi:hypothetical protein